jgi:hypothetical protein
MVVAGEVLVEGGDDVVVTTTVVGVDDAVVSAPALVVGAVDPLDEHPAHSAMPPATTTTHHPA